MLTLNSFFYSSCRTFGLAAVLASSALVGITDAQQTPAQRYEPVRSNVYDTQKPDNYSPEKVHREGVRQIGYQQAAETTVPAILAGASNAARNEAFALPASGSAAIGSHTQTMPMKSPSDFASQMGVSPTAFASAKSSRVAAQTAAIPVGVIPQQGTLPAREAQPAAAQPAAPSAQQIAD